MNAISDIQAGKGLTRALSEQARKLRLQDIPDTVRDWARQCVLDYLGCGIAGASDELVTILLAEMQEQGGKEVASVLGRAGRLPVASAAIVNGAASHALDFDDVNLAMPGHPSVAILPALLALAEERGSSGADVLTAFVAGYELQCRVGRTIAPGHYDGLGFHATATVGSFGAAAACAHLLGLDARSVRSRTGYRWHPGGRAEVDVRHDVQAAACRQGGVSWGDGGETGRAGLHRRASTSSSARRVLPAPIVRISIPSGRSIRRRADGGS